MVNVAPNPPPVEKAFPPEPLPPARPAGGSVGDWRTWTDSAAKFIAEHPGASLASALILGAALAWWIKRR